MNSNNYFDKQELKRTGLRLFCFPYAGGGPSVFRKWQEGLGGGINVCPAHYPGHEERIMEKPLIDMDTLVSNIFKEMNIEKQDPFILFGHSVGSRLAYELAVRFEKAGEKNLLGIIVSAGLAPYRAEPNPIYHLPDAEFFRGLSRYSRTATEIFENKELWAIFEPMLRADFRISDTYCDQVHEKINVPILALRGRADLEVSQKDLLEWKAYTTTDFLFADVDGGHLFIDTNTEKTLEIIRGFVSRYRDNSKTV